ncbi:GNAT family N-acetyltransferase [Longispora sp. K20-0274]|uniref:GNAT family N-acetyltransferase n=1 Tax=Longispora sp. K20-0274 TaxID=3088255 RepID=UPI00399AD17A
MGETTAGPAVRIEPWSAGDLDLLRRINAPEMTEHLGGPETDEQVIARHARYVAAAGTARMFRIVALPEDEPVGGIGFWDRTWRGEEVYETGWSVVPGFQGRGIAVSATRALVEAARADGRHRFVHAFPSVDNPPSNAICRRLGFELLGECDFEYPPGNMLRCNDWRLEL